MATDPDRFGHYKLFGPHLVFQVRGRPVTQGSKRSVTNTSKAGNVVSRVLDDNPKTKDWRLAMQDGAEKALAALPAVWMPFPLDGPVAVDVTFTWPKPKSAPRTRISYPDRKPDVDKLVRAALDSLKDAGVYRDDGQVVQVSTRKAYPNEHAETLPVPGVWIYVYTVGSMLRMPPSTSDTQEGP